MKQLFFFILSISALIPLEADAETNEDFNFSEVWMAYQDDILGYIDTNYQRLYIHYDRIRKQAKGDYLISGKMKCKNEINLLEGVIKVISVSDAEFVNGLDDEEGIKKHVVSSSWQLHVLNQNLEVFGSISGKMVSYFYIKDEQCYFFDYDLSFSDGFCNNQFEGEYKDTHDPHLSRPVCWGAFRIPNSGDLDIGASEFSPNEKYLSNGWDSYRKAQEIGNEDAWKIEKQPWWNSFEANMWTGDSRSYVVEFYKRLINNQDLNSLIWIGNGASIIPSIMEYRKTLLQDYSEKEILDFVEKSECFTDGERADTTFRIHFPNGQDVYFEISELCLNNIWLPDGTDICYSDLFFYRPAIINDSDGYVNIRAKANGKSKIVGKIKEGELFYFTPNSYSNWYRVYKGENQPCLGYIHKSKIVTFKDFPENLKEYVRKIRGGC